MTTASPRIMFSPPRRIICLAAAYRGECPGVDPERLIEEYTP